MRAQNRSEIFGQAGFTLIEMMAVVAVMALLLLLIVARGAPHSGNLTLRAAGGDVAGALRAARAVAIAQGAPVAFTIYAKTGVYGAAGSTHALPRGVAVAVVARPITLAPDGSASAATIRLTLGRLVETVTLDWLTGGVTAGPVQAAQ